MTLTVDLSPQEEARLAAAASQERLLPAEMAKKLLTDHLPPLSASPSGIDPENAAAIALLQKWLQEEATEDPEKIRQAEQELEAFKQNLNL